MFHSSAAAAIAAAALLLHPPGALVRAIQFTCPSQEGSILLKDAAFEDPSLPPGSTQTVSFPTTDKVGEVCILSLLVPDGPVPIARSFDGRAWEKKAGLFANAIEEPICDGPEGLCKIDLPTDRETLGPNGENMYMLTTTRHEGTREAECARFLEQATFGQTRSGIDELATTKDEEGSPDFAGWVEHQMDPSPAGAGISSHREIYRSHSNARFENPNIIGTAGPHKACDITSRWRKFAFTERDGLMDLKSKISKYLTIEKRNGKYVYFVEGMARTWTSNLGNISDVDGKVLRKLRTGEPYKIDDGKYLNDNMKYSCIDCPVRICADFGCGYIQNPKVQLPDSNLVKYGIVELPDIMTNDGKMVSIDDGPFLEELTKWQKPNDEFYLNTDEVNESYCSDHPSTAIPVKSELKGVPDYLHMSTVTPPIFGRTNNAETGKIEILLFDPTFRNKQNTVENPLPDGGGSMHDETDGVTKCSNAVRTFLNEDHCKLSFHPLACFNEDEYNVRIGNGKGVVVCGSPGEVASDITNGVINGYISSARKPLDIYKSGSYTEYKYNLWYRTVLSANDQLRQRVAWALCQIVVISLPGGFYTSNEPEIIFYDIFVRHAFGSYRNVLKEASYHYSMGKYLTFKGNKSIQWSRDDTEAIHFPDENYAREIMQLFSIGVEHLNMDGTRKLDDYGVSIPTYTTDDIMNYARVWTGFVGSINRGNVERGERLDPMGMDVEGHDIFPKSDLSGGFIGDGYPLCADLPEKDFLREGATYRLLGSRSRPELQEDDKEWEENSIRLGLHHSSPLYKKLCAPDANNVCTFPVKVVLDSNLIYDAAAQEGSEYEVDTIRTVRVQDGNIPIYYEYLHQPCVHQNFFNNGQKIIRGKIKYDRIVKDSMCADPRTHVAAESCCDEEFMAIRYCTYNGERMKYNSAINRCLSNDQQQCNPKRWLEDVCMDESTYAWSSSECEVKVKISYEQSHMIARVDRPVLSDFGGERRVKNFVQDDTINFFKVPWVSDSGVPTDEVACNSIASCYSVSDGCVCETTVTEMAYFDAVAGSIFVKENVEVLKIGSVPPTTYNNGEYIEIDCGIAGLKVFLKTSALGSCDNLNIDTIFHVIDNNGVGKYLKNMVSYVDVIGTTGIKFRNPVHFIDFADRSERDIHYEIDAALDTYFYHPSHPPFLALRMIQRFGVSNPSPQYIERVSTAYKNGTYLGRFGDGNYGNLGAMMAAILLDPEARAFSLDSDPSHGHVREPIIKITSFLRSLETKWHAPFQVSIFNGPSGTRYYGQGPYRAPSVFSFFQPEYAPAGSILNAGLVSPESNMLDVRLLRLTNSIFQTVKFGVSQCYAGFGRFNFGAACPRNEGVITNDAFGELTYTAESGATADDVLDELSLLMTSSRLSETNRRIIKDAFRGTYDSGDKEKGIRIAQQLLFTTPEFHTTNLAHTSGTARHVSSYTDNPPPDSYKAVVFFYMDGGADTFNMLVPKSGCSGGRDYYKEYREKRGKVALNADELLNIDARSSNQVCDTFGVNNNFPLLQKLYQEKEAIFFANTGVLAKNLDKSGWEGSQKQGDLILFAHNHMAGANSRIDGNNGSPGTGVGGRLLDILRRQGFHTSANEVDGKSIFNQGSSFDNNPSWNIALDPIYEMDQKSTIGPEMFDIVKALNGDGKPGNSLYGDTFSERTAQIIFEYEFNLEMKDLMDSGEFDMDLYPLGSDLNNKFRAAAQYMKSRHERKVNREVYVVREYGFDHHSEGVKDLNKQFENANDALHFFMDELKREKLWDDTVIVLGSDFGRSITNNASGGTDHAWGGNYFMIGGGLDGGKILGEFPEYLSDKDSQWIKRGIMIPTTPWESVWNGVANWMGVRGDDHLNYVLPNRANFGKCQMFTDEDLFKFSQVPHSSCQFFDSDGDGVPDEDDKCPDTQYWKEDEPIDADGCSVSEPTSSPITRAPVSIIPTPSPTAYPTADVSERKPVHTVLDINSAIKRVGGSSDGSGAESIDATTNKEVLFVDGTGAPGFIAIPTWPWSIVTGIRVYTANDGKSRDPAKYILEGKVNEADQWYEIQSGDLNLPWERNPQHLPVTSTFGSPDMSLQHQEILFTNDRVFSRYRVTFPELKKVGSSVLQFAEVELPGYLVGADDANVPTRSPVFQTPKPTEIPTRSPVKDPTRRPTGSPIGSPTVSTGSPSRSPSTTKSCVNEPTPTHTVLDNNALVTFVGSSRAAEYPSDAVDGTTSKFRIEDDKFKDLDPGLIAVPSCGSSIVKGIRFYASSSTKWYDPTSYVLEGRSDDFDIWHPIAKGQVNMPRNRNPDGLQINSSFASADDSYKSDESTFLNNEEAYSQYRVLFPTTRGNEDSVILAELELPGILLPGADNPNPTSAPTDKITNSPTTSPTDKTSNSPTSPPTDKISNSPTSPPTDKVSNSPTSPPTDKISNSPTSPPTDKVSNSPTSPPTDKISNSPSVAMSDEPTLVMSGMPSSLTTPVPSFAPSIGSVIIKISNVLDSDTKMTFVGAKNKPKKRSRIADNSTTKFTINFEEGSKPGFKAVPKNSMTIVKAIRFYASNNKKGRDPVKYQLYGRKDGSDWEKIASSDMEFPKKRNNEGRLILSSFSSGDKVFSYFEDTFDDNDTIYSEYRVLFPKRRSGSSLKVSLSEVELPGFIILPPPTPTPKITGAPSSIPTPKITDAPTTEPTPKITDAPTNEPTPKKTDAPTTEPTPKITDAPSIIPTPKITDAPTNEPTPKKTDAPSGYGHNRLVNNVLGPDTVYTYINASNDPKDPTKISNGIADREVITPNYKLGTPGLIAKPAEPSVVHKVRFYNSNTCKGCDPQGFTLEGKFGDDAAWESIAQGSCTTSRSRNSGEVINSTYASGDNNLKFCEFVVEAENRLAHSQYRMYFTKTREDNASGVAIGELEFVGMTNLGA